MGDDGASVHEGVCGIVIDLFGDHRFHDGDVIGNCTDMWQVVADQLATLTVAPKSGPRPEATQLLALELGDGHPPCEGLRHRLPVEQCQFRFLIKGLQMTGSSRHAQEDDSLGSRYRTRCREQFGCADLSGGPPLAQRCCTDTQRQRTEKLSAVQIVNLVQNLILCVTHGSSFHADSRWRGRLLPRLQDRPVR